MSRILLSTPESLAARATFIAGALRRHGMPDRARQLDACRSLFLASGISSERFQECIDFAAQAIAKKVLA